MSNLSTTAIRQGDRLITTKEISYIRDFIQMFPALPRQELTNTICEHLEWLSPSGQPKFTACTKLLSRLDEAGEISLPPLQEERRHFGPRPSRADSSNTEDLCQTAISCSLSDLKPVQLLLTQNRQEEIRWNGRMKQHHPLGYKKPFGYPLRYFIEANAQPLGCILLSGAAKALTDRDQWIGWNRNQRMKNLPWIINNARFLIFPWVQVPHLASHVLGQLARRVADDCELRWGFRPLLMETFVDPEHFAGICYRAAGWECLGRTTGVGLARPGKQYKTSPKLIFVKPLQMDFRRLLCSDTLKGRTEL